MNTSNKLSSFIGSLVIAFAITLILPSAASAHGHQSHGTNTQCVGDQAANYRKYKRLAQKYLDAYYRCYDYTYYRYYVYYMKKANACKPKQAKNNCTQYKILADKYLAAYQRCGYYIYYRYYLYYMNLYKQVCDQNTDTTGKVCGLVYEDTNGNGIQDAGEPAYAGAKVKITDETGNTFTATTGANGRYCQSGVAEGDATVEVDPTSLPANADVTTENPTTINVEAGKNNQAGKDGFEIIIPTGKVCGLVFEDTNGNGIQDAGEAGYAGAGIAITDETGQVHGDRLGPDDTYNIFTDANGKYCVDGIAEGTASIDVDPKTLPEYADITTGLPTVNVEAGKKNQADKIGIKKATGEICGEVYEDTNGNGLHDTGEAGYGGAKINITDVYGSTYTATTDANGDFCQGGIGIGDAVVEVDPSSLPENTTITSDSQLIIPVDPNDIDFHPAEFGIQLPHTLTGSVCGTVYVDVNKNGLKDYGEPGIADITVTITDSNGKVTSVETDADGKYCANGIAEGKAIVDVDENDPDMPAGSEPTLNPDPSPVNVIANKHNDAGIDGYYNPHSGLGCICTIVYIDKNRDGKYKYDDGDRGIKGVTVTLVDSKGTTHTLQTNASGVITAVLPLGEVTMSIDENDPHIPADMVLHEGQGKNPVTFENTSRQNSPTHYGFQLD